MSRRHQSHTERDLAGLAARKEREAAVPDFVEEDLTGQFANDPDELKRRRKRRSTGERLERVEEKYDALIGKVIASNTARMNARTKIIVAVVGLAGAIVGAIVAAMAGCG